jgi:Flp pilus assembly protein TadG
VSAWTGAPAGTGQRGQAAVELVLALPAVVAVLLLVVQVGLVGRDQLLVVHAAREAARAASVERAPEASASAATAAARAAPGLNPARLSVDTRVDEEVVRVTVRYRAPTEVPLVGALVGEPTLEASVAMRLEASSSDPSEPP